jgi:16S rRNA (uracil1498-N3)-methyltransferase
MKKNHWFLIKDLKTDKEITIKDKELLHQFNRVLKFKNGEKIVLFNGKGTWIKCEIKNLQNKECVLDALESDVKQHNENKLINLYFGIPKKNKFELILEKGTEVGVTSFIPLITDRTEKLNIKEERVSKILIEASEQSENPILPSVAKVRPWKEVIQDLDSKNTFVFHAEGENLNICDLKISNEINLLIGPEGGWSEDELKILKDRNFKIYKVGDSVLKTETAAIVIPFLFSIS